MSAPAEALASALAPYPETALACRVALAPAESARQAWVEWHRLLGPEGIKNASRATGRLVPLIAGRLSELGLADGPDTARLDGVHRWMLSQNAMLWHDLRPLLERLLRRGLRVALVGGLGRARTVYPDFGARYLGRADLWIPPAELDQALAIVAADPAWQARFSIVARPPVSDRHLFLGPRGTQLVLRSHLIPESLGHPADPWQRCLPLPIEGLALLQPAPEHALLQVAVDAVHARAVAAPERFVDWLPDLALTIARRAPDWALVIAEAQRHEVSLTLATTLSCLPPIGLALHPAVLPALLPHGRHEARALAARLDPRGRPIDAIWRDYRHQVAPHASALIAGAGFLRYAALRLGVRGPTDLLRVAPSLWSRLRARFEARATQARATSR